MSNSIQGVYQGSFMPLNEIRVSPLSRAYTFSDSIYEVIPYYSGKPLCLDEHIDRFKVSANFLKIEFRIPKALNSASLVVNMVFSNFQNVPKLLQK